MTRGSMVRIASALLLCAAPDLHAQMCHGRPSFAVAPMNVSGDVTTGDEATTITGGWNFGSLTYFGGFDLGLTTFDDFDGTASSLMGEIGTHIRPGGVLYLEMCPFVRLGLAMGPDDVPAGNDTDLDLRQYDVQAGVGLGGMVPVVRGLVLMPFGDFALAYQRQNADWSNGNSSSDTDTYGLLGAGVRLSFDNRFTIGPKLTIPLGLQDSDPIWGLGFTFAFGTR
jgi:hypothetical protein